MMKSTYNFAAGVLLIIVALVFFFSPSFIDIDAFFPFIFSVVAFILGVGFLFMGNAQK